MIGNKIKKLIKKTGSYLTIFITLIISIGCYVEVSESCKDNTIVFLDKSTLVYYSPPCVMPEGYNNLSKLIEYASEHGFLVTTIRDVNGNSKLNRDEECFNNSGGLATSHSLLTELLLNVNLAPWHKPRWNDDGTWNW